MSSYQTAYAIIEKADDEVPMLVEDLLPKKGLAAIAGESEVGKSSFLRELGLSVALNRPTFIGRKLNVEHNRVLYISTEDSIDNLGPGLKCQVEVLDYLGDERLKNYFFIDDISDLNNKLNEIVEMGPLDLIIIDSFSDFMKRDMNSANEVRKILSYFNRISIDNDCLVLILHHIRKSANAQSASKADLLGSTGFEGKMRAVIMLMNGHNADVKKLRIVKGNYLSPEVKKQDTILKFNNLVFEVTGNAEIINSNPVEETNDKAIEVVEELLPELENGMLIKDLFEKALEMEYPFGKSKFYEQVKELKSSNYHL